MEILNLGGAEESNTPAPRSRKKLRVILGIGALAAVTGLGSTLAANISLNGGGNVEFGQGVATTAACDDDITLTPVSTFSNSYEDATFAMTAIQVSGIDLTPEGWDVSEETWATGWNWETNSWNSGYEQYSGQYLNYNDVWTNTCAGKSLMLRAYTDDSDFAERATDNNISNPLYLNGNNSSRPFFMDGNNNGVGFRMETPAIDSSSYDNFAWNIADCDYNCTFTSTGVLINYGGQYYDENSTVTIFLDEDPYYPPADSRWVDKLTIESAATTPNNWSSDNLG